MTMNHAAEGTLQAWLDGELGTSEVSELERHVGVCPTCTRELEGLRSAARRFSSAVALLDAAPASALAAVPLSMRTRRAWYGPRRVLARAATLIVALGLSAALLEATTGVVSDLVERVGGALGGTPRTEVAAPSAAPEAEAEAEPSSVGFDPRAGVARIAVENAPAGITVRVRLHDEPDVLVLVRGGGEPEFRLGPGEVFIPASRAEQVEIALPRDLELGYVDVNGVRYLTKEGDDLRWAVVPADTADAVLEWTLPRR